MQYQQWLRYRHNDRAREGEWLYKRVNTDGSMKPMDWLDVLEPDYCDYDDAYRGTEIEYIDSPPVDWVRKEIRITTDSIAHKQMFIKDLWELLDKAGVLTNP